MKHFSLIVRLMELILASLLKLQEINSLMTCLTKQALTLAKETPKVVDSPEVHLISVWVDPKITAVECQALAPSNTPHILWSSQPKTKMFLTKPLDNKCASNPTAKMLNRLLLAACFPSFLGSNNSSSLNRNFRITNEI